MLSQRKWFTFDKYIQAWKWDDAKYPKMRGLTNNLNSLLTTVNQLDDAARNKTTQFNELKSQQANIAKKDTGTLASRDLIDVLTPNSIDTGDFVETEHLTTIPVVVPTGAPEQYFLSNYEWWDDKVLPMSAKKFNTKESEEAMAIWRVVIFRSAVEGFKKKCRDEKFVARDFTFSYEKYEALQAKREELKKEYEKQDKNMKGFCKASWSDCMIAWVHIKAMRVFVESVLRFGVPPLFTSFLLQPKPSATTQLRKSLADLFSGSRRERTTEDLKEAEEEDYYPYVSLTFTPFSPSKQN